MNKSEIFSEVSYLAANPSMRRRDLYATELRFQNQKTKKRPSFDAYYFNL